MASAQLLLPWADEMEVIIRNIVRPRQGKYAGFRARFQNLCHQPEDSLFQIDSIGA